MNQMPDHLSYSSISLYLSCAKAWKFRYLDRVQTATSPELVWGSAFHDTVEAHIAGRDDGGLITAWQTNWQKRTEGVDVDWGMSNADHYLNEGIRILSHEDVQKALHKLTCGFDDQGPKIERKIVLRVPGVPVDIIGYIDGIDPAGTPFDLKTSAKSWTADKAQSETQTLFYLAALNQAGIRVPDLAFRHVIFVKTKTPQVQILEHRHRVGEMLWLFSMIRSVWRGVEAEVYPENPTSWKCSPQYCDVWNFCRGKF